VLTPTIRLFREPRHLELYLSGLRVATDEKS
jgi:hypothetical protein